MGDEIITPKVTDADIQNFFDSEKGKKFFNPIFESYFKEKDEKIKELETKISTLEGGIVNDGKEKIRKEKEGLLKNIAEEFLANDFDDIIKNVNLDDLNAENAKTTVENLKSKKPHLFKQNFGGTPPPNLQPPSTKTFEEQIKEAQSKGNLLEVVRLKNSMLKKQI
jgi:hypothetical protein